MLADRFAEGLADLGVFHRQPQRTFGDPDAARGDVDAAKFESARGLEETAMSGGEQQILAIGRALMTRPKIIMLDEPSLGLSPKFVEVVFEKLLALRDEGLTVVMVEQKASKALGISDRGYVMNLGQVAYAGSAQELLHNDDVKRVFLGEIPESLKMLSTNDA